VDDAKVRMRAAQAGGCVTATSTPRPLQAHSTRQWWR
jgi:hypothetical protein